MDRSVTVLEKYPKYFNGSDCSGSSKYLASSKREPLLHLYHHQAKKKKTADHYKSVQLLKQIEQKKVEQEKDRHLMMLNTMNENMVKRNATQITHQYAILTTRLNKLRHFLQIRRRHRITQRKEDTLKFEHKLNQTLTPALLMTQKLKLTQDKLKLMRIAQDKLIKKKKNPSRF